MNKKKYQHCKRNYVVFHASSFIKKSLSNEDFLKQICIHDERRNPIQPLYIKRPSNSVVTRIIFFPITWNNDPCILLFNRSNHFTVFIKLIDCIKYFTHKMSGRIIIFDGSRTWPLSNQNNLITDMKMTTDGILGHCLQGQTRQCSGAKPVNGIPTIPFLISRIHIV